MTNSLNHLYISSLQLISLIYFINLIQSSSNHLNQIKPCATFKSGGCLNLAMNNPNNLPQIQDKHLLNHLSINLPNQLPIGPISTHSPLVPINLKSSNYIPNNHAYKLTPIDHLERRQLDVYQNGHYNKHENVKQSTKDLHNKTNEIHQNLNYNQNSTDLPVSEALVKPVFSLPDGLSLNQSYFLLNATSLPLKRGNKQLIEIYGDLNSEKHEVNEKIEQINAWLAESSHMENGKTRQADGHNPNQIDKNIEMEQSESELQSDYVNTEDDDQHESNKGNEKKSITVSKEASSNYNLALTGASKTPPCAKKTGRFYCSYKEDYPDSIVAEITKYYKWPLEKLFRDLRQSTMPKLASDNYGGLVCDAITRVVRPGWARNTANRWYVVLNTDEYQQYVTEILCRDSNSKCNFIPPCYQATCKQRFNTQKLLVIDPFNRFKGPFLSEFLFPSCCVCYIPELEYPTMASNLKPTYTKKIEEKSNAKSEF